MPAPTPTPSATQTPTARPSPSATAPPTRPAATATHTPQPSATPGCSETSGQLIETGYPGAVVPETIPLLVYLPPCAGEAAGYPAVYLLHGLPYDERHWLELGAVERFEQGLAAGAWEPMVLVLPYQPEPLFSSTDGGEGSYEQEFLEGLVPFVELSYPADPARRGLAGISRGGIWALEIALRNPQSIGALAALSPALAVNYARPDYDPLRLVQTPMDRPAAILLLAGERDWTAAETEHLGQLMSDQSIEHKFTLVPGDHSDPTWTGALDTVFTFFSEALSRP